MPVYKQPNGKWRAIVQVDRHRRSAVAATLKDAKRLEAKLMIELGKSPDASEIVLEDLIDLYLQEQKRAITTTEDYRYLLGKVPPWFLAWKVQNVTAIMLTQAYKRMLAETWKINDKIVGPFSVHRIRRLHGIVAPAFKYAVVLDLIPDKVSPAAAIKMPAAPDSQVEAPDPASVLEIVRRADAWDETFGCALRVVANTGCRRGELCALQWDDIDLKTGSVLIRRSISTTTDNPHTVTTGKTGKKGWRAVSIGPSVVASLKAHKARQTADLFAKGVRSPKWVFTPDGRDPWRTDYVTLAFSRLRDAEPALDLHLHQLRHHVATVLIAAGIDIKTVSGRLGHSRVATTADMYASVVPARDREAANILDAFG